MAKQIHTWLLSETAVKLLSACAAVLGIVPPPPPSSLCLRPTTRMEEGQAVNEGIPRAKQAVKAVGEE